MDVPISLRRAQARDFEVVTALVDKAAEWLRTKNTDQWAQPWRSQEDRDSRILRDLQAGRTWIAFDQQTPIATITINELADITWPELARGESAVYVDRLVVDRSYAGAGLGSRLLDWAGVWAGQQYGAKWIRVSAWTTNAPLRDYFLRQGFEFSGFSDIVDNPSGALFQKPINSIDTSAVAGLIQVSDSEDGTVGDEGSRYRQESAGTAVDLAEPQRFYASLSEPCQRLWRRALLLESNEELSPATVAILLQVHERTARARLREFDEAVSRLAGGRSRLESAEFADFAAAQLSADDPDELEAIRHSLRRRRAAERGVAPKPGLASDFWTTDDRLGYRPYADAIAAFVRHADTKPPLTIGIKGPWGAGKTSLMRMVQEELDPADAIGERRRIRLTADSRKRLRPRRLGRQAGDPQETLRNLEVLQQAAPPTSMASSPQRPLHTEPDHDQQTQASDDWRPTVWFNPWMYQTGEQIWAGLAQEIITQVTARLPPVERERFWLQLNLARIDREAVRRRAYRLLLERLTPFVLVFGVVVIVTLVILVLGQLFSPWGSITRQVAAAIFSAGSTGVVIGGLAQVVRFLRESASDTFSQLVQGPAALSRRGLNESTGFLANIVHDPGYQARTGFLQLVQTDIPRVLDLVATPDRPLVVFVDDLDRCAAGTIAQVIEAINLFLAGQFPNCVFVLGMEPEVVAAHVEVAYKDLMEKLREGSMAVSYNALGWRFLEKIVQLPLSLPAQDEQHVAQYVRALFNMPTGHPRVPDVADESEESKVVSGERSTHPYTAPGRAPVVQSPDQVKMIQDLEVRIRARRPSLDSLPEVAHEVQAEFLNEGDSLANATAEAVNRVFADLYSDSAACEAIENGLKLVGSINPRDIKRYINLFRFYTFITYRKHLDGGPAIPDRQIAKLAALVVRWPDLLGVLARRNAEDKSFLYILERAAIETSGRRPADDSENLWRRELQDLGLCSGQESQSPAWNQFYEFLAAAPEVAEVAAGLL